jgi:hypothetical protein
MRDLVVSSEWIACAELARLFRYGCRREYNIRQSSSSTPGEIVVFDNQIDKTWRADLSLVGRGEETAMLMRRQGDGQLLLIGRMRPHVPLAR